jgi:hypothetical protein
LSLVIDYFSLENIVLWVREVLRERAFWYCKIFSWVRRSSPAAGCTGREREREMEREDLLAKSADQNCKIYLNIS